MNSIGDRGTVLRADGVHGSSKDKSASRLFLLHSYFPAAPGSCLMLTHDITTEKSLP